MPFNPEVVAHEIDAGAQFAGVAPNGTSSGEARNRGRQVFYTAGTAGGLFGVPDFIGASLSKVCFKAEMDDAANAVVAIRLVDPDAVEYTLKSVAGVDAQDFVWEPPVLQIVPPGWAVKVLSNRNVSAGKVGRAVVFWGAGWGHKTFDQIME